MNARAERSYRWLLRLYPREFRRRFEPEMLELFADRYAAAPRSVRGRARFWCGVVGDSVVSAFREHFPARHPAAPPRSMPMTTLGFDIRQAWRVLVRTPSFTLFVVALMALSIGSTTAVFSVIDAVLLRPFPFAHPDRLVVVWERQSAENVRNVVGAHEFPEWRDRNRSFSGMAAMIPAEFALTGAGDPEALVGVRVTSDFFPVMGIAPALGRVFDAEADQPGHGQVALISSRLWRQRFGSDPSIPGRTIRLNDQPFTVLGVMPASFQFPPGPAGAVPDVWTPIAEPIHLYRGRHYLFVVARLKDGVTIAQAQADMDAIAAHIAAELPQFSKGHGVNIVPLHRELVSNVQRALLILFAGVTLVLIVGCCNVANLLVARASMRQHEIAVRSALGAGRLRIARQLVGEGALLSLAGGAAGILLARWLLHSAAAAAPEAVPRFADAGIDTAALAFASAVCLATTVVFGMAPFAHAMRVDVGDRLKHGARGTARPGRERLRRAVVVVEVALTVTVAVGSALFLQSFYRLLRIDPGFVRENVLAMDVALPPARYRTPASHRAFFDRAVERIRALPGVQSAAVTNLVPQGDGISGIAIGIEGRPAPPPGEEASASFRVVSPDYFRTLGIPLRSGRTFTEQDARAAVPLIRWFEQQPLPPGFGTPQPRPVALINETMARTFWRGDDPIGRRFTVLFSPPVEIVGVVRDTRNQSLGDEPVPEFILCDCQEPQTRMTLLVRSGGDPASLAPAVRAAFWSIDRDLPASNIRTLEDVVDRNLSLYRAVTWLLAGFAAIALVLMTLGVYAVISYSTAQRLYEIGVRIALGARRSDIRRLIVGSGLVLALAGIAAGLAGAYILARFATDLLFEVKPADPLTYAGLSGMVIAIVALASWIPARRAQRVDPVRVLRSE